MSRPAVQHAGLRFVIHLIYVLHGQEQATCKGFLSSARIWCGIRLFLAKISQIAITMCLISYMEVLDWLGCYSEHRDCRVALTALTGKRADIQGVNAEP